MPDISLTDFVDFVGKNGTSRMTHVRQVKERTDYSPAKDYWKRLRDGITEYHQMGASNKGILDAICDDLTDAKKRRTYPIAVEAYKKFLGRKKISWFCPANSTWQYGELSIRINPELGLEINGSRHQIKLYFKGSPLRKDKADIILLLLRDSLSTDPGDSYAVLDVQRSKLYADPAPSLAIKPLLQGEAASFATIWKGLP